MHIGGKDLTGFIKPNISESFYSLKFEDIDYTMYDNINYVLFEFSYINRIIISVVNCSTVIMLFV